MKIIIVPEELLRNLTGEEVELDWSKFWECEGKGKLNVSEAINIPNVELKGKDLTDEAVLNESIEVMRNEIKEAEADTSILLHKAEVITMLSREIRECINMKNYIEISNRQYESEEATC